MSQAGERVGLQVFTMARYRASPVSDGTGRTYEWLASCTPDGDDPLETFRKRVLRAVEDA